jgi:hypothetical protein
LRINAVVIRDGGFEGVKWCSVDSGNLFQSVIVLGKKDSFLYSVLQDGIWKRLVRECRVCLFCGMSLSVFWISTLSLLFCRTYSNVIWCIAFKNYCLFSVGKKILNPAV